MKSVIHKAIKKMGGEIRKPKAMKAPDMLSREIARKWGDKNGRKDY